MCDGYLDMAENKYQEDDYDCDPTKRICDMISL